MMQYLTHCTINSLVLLTFLVYVDHGSLSGFDAQLSSVVVEDPHSSSGVERRPAHVWHKRLSNRLAGVGVCAGTVAVVARCGDVQRVPHLRGQVEVKVTAVCERWRGNEFLLGVSR